MDSVILPASIRSSASILHVAARSILLVAMTQAPAAAQMIGNEAPAALVYATFDGAIAIPGTEDLSNGPRIGVVLTAYPSGWGLAYAHQRLTLEPLDPTQDLVDEVQYRSILLVKEFQLRTPFMRPCVEAGASLVKYEHDVTRTNTALMGSSTTYSSSSTEHVAGVDLRLRMLFSLSSRLGLQVALHSSINVLHTYHSIDVGIAFGCVRPKLSKRIVPAR